MVQDVESVHKIIVWWSGEFKSWCVSFYDFAGNAIGESEYIYRKTDAVTAAKLRLSAGDCKVVVIQKRDGSAQKTIGVQHLFPPRLIRRMRR